MAVSATVRTTDTFDAGPLNTTRWASKAPSSGSGGGILFDRAGFINLRTSNVGNFSGAGATWLAENVTPNAGNSDVEVRTRFIVDSTGGSVQLFARNSTVGDGNRYALALDIGNDRVSMLKIVGGISASDLATPISFTMPVGTYVNTALRVWLENGVTNIAAKMWKDGVAEPDAWSFQSTDASSPYLSGYSGIVGYPQGATTNLDWDFDYLTISALTTAVVREQTVTDTLRVTDQLLSTKVPAVEDVMRVVDGVSWVGDFVREHADDAGLVDTFGAAAEFVLTFDDEVGIVCEALPSAIRPVTVTDEAGLLDDPGPRQFEPAHSEPGIPTEGPITIHGQLPADEAGLVDELGIVGEFVRLFDDAAGLVEEADLAREIPVDEVVGIVDDPRTAVAYLRVIDDTLTVGDDVARTVEFGRSIDDGTGVVDTFNTALGNIRYWTHEVVDDLGIVDEPAARESVWQVRIDDEVGPVDLFNGMGDQERRFDEWVTLTDEVFIRLDYGVHVTEEPLAGDLASFRIVAPVEWRRTVVDDVTPRESLAPTGRKPRGRGTSVLAAQPVGQAVLRAQQVAVAELVE